MSGQLVRLKKALSVIDPEGKMVTIPMNTILRSTGVGHKTGRLLFITQEGLVASCTPGELSTFFDTSIVHREAQENEQHIASNVNHPDHYNRGSIECIDAIKAALTEEEFRGYLKGNAMKYIWRERNKGGVESIRKAEWHLTRIANDHA